MDTTKYFVMWAGWDLLLVPPLGDGWIYASQPICGLHAKRLWMKIFFPVKVSCTFSATAGHCVDWLGQNRVKKQNVSKCKNVHRNLHSWTLDIFDKVISTQGSGLFNASTCITLSSNLQTPFLNWEYQQFKQKLKTLKTNIKNKLQKKKQVSRL